MDYLKCIPFNSEFPCIEKWHPVLFWIESLCTGWLHECSFIHVFGLVNHHEWFVVVHDKSYGVFLCFCNYYCFQLSNAFSITFFLLILV